jgi:hypothetical protein
MTPLLLVNDAVVSSESYLPYSATAVRAALTSLLSPLVNVSAAAVAAYLHVRRRLSDTAASVLCTHV